MTLVECLEKRQQQQNASVCFSFILAVRDVACFYYRE